MHFGCFSAASAVFDVVVVVVVAVDVFTVGVGVAVAVDAVAIVVIVFIVVVDDSFEMVKLVNEPEKAIELKKCTLIIKVNTSKIVDA